MTVRIEMQPYNFKVVPSDDESAHVPVSVAGQTMVDVQNLLSDIGTMMVRQELRLQNSVPGSLTRRFTLSMEASAGRDVGASAEGSDTLMQDAIERMMEELDTADIPFAKGEPENHREVLARRRLAQHIVALHDHLEGYDFRYGKGDSLRRFRLTRVDALRAVAEDTSQTFVGTAVGVIMQDPVRRNRWLISNGRDTVPITFASNIPATDIPLFVKAGPIIASGTVVTDESGDIREMRGVTGCFTFPSVKFHRVITADRDIILLNPVEAAPGYNAPKGLWTLDCDDLGISVSKHSWDECVVAFHEYFVFLWETYAESDDEFEGEEKDIRDLLLSMVPFVADE